MNELSLIKMQSIGYSVGGFSLLTGVSASVDAGSVTAIVGGNGAGKSTLLKAIAGQLDESYIQGDLVFNLTNSDVADVTEGRQLSIKELAQNVAYLPQQSEIFFPLKVKEVVALGLLPHSLSAEKEKSIVAKALSQFDLEHLANRDIRQLSGGEKQRCQLARSYSQLTAMEQGIWLLDEPMNNLDIQHQQQLLALIKKCQLLGHTVLMIVHDLNVALRLADQVWVMHESQLVMQGDPNQILTSETVAQYFKVKARRFKDQNSEWLLIE